MKLGTLTVEDLKERSIKSINRIAYTNQYRVIILIGVDVVRISYGIQLNKWLLAYDANHTDFTDSVWENLLSQFSDTELSEIKNG